MESLGPTLKGARERKKCSLNEASKETNIAQHYLEALETEDFDKFPGETYITGFLRNYSEFLGLDPAGTLSLYRSIRIQEQPVPEALLKPPSRAPKIIKTVVIILLSIGAAGGGVWLFMNAFGRPPIAAPRRPPAVYTMEGESLERRFYKGDTIILPLIDASFRVTVAEIGDFVILNTPEPVALFASQEQSLDIDKNGIFDINVTALEFARDNPDAGVRLSVKKAALQPAALVPAEAAAVTADAAAADTAQGAAQGARQTPIFPSASASAYPFSVEAQFSGYCLFRKELLFEREKKRDEHYYERGGALTIEAQNGVRIWASNAGVVKLQITAGSRTAAVDLGSAGEVVVADIRWVRGEDNRYRLVLSPLD